MLRSFRLEMPVEPHFHPKIIGRRGAIVNKIRLDHDVQIVFPDKTSETPDIIVIIGIEEKTLAAHDDILKIIHELVGRLSDITPVSAVLGWIP